MILLIYNNVLHQYIIQEGDTYILYFELVSNIGSDAFFFTYLQELIKKTCNIIISLV